MFFPVLAMALTYSTYDKTPIDSFLAPDFNLKGVDEKSYSLADFKNQELLVIIFMCNHCPYVIAVQNRINQLAKKFGPKKVGVIGINSNDPVRYPADSFPKMQERAREEGFVFSYVQDPTQEVAKAYDAVCTPDPYLFQNDGTGTFTLRYHGRIDDSWKEEKAVQQHELADAINALLAGKPVSSVVATQHPAMGCSIKWK